MQRPSICVGILSHSHKSFRSAQVTRLAAGRRGAFDPFVSRLPGVEG
jgi:hypothetical protein